MNIMNPGIPVTEISLLGAFCIIFAMIGLILGCFFLLDESVKGTAISLCIGVLAIALILIFPQYTIKCPTGKWTYIVEITDEAKYKELVDTGYEFTRIYDNYTIYQIKGDKLNESNCAPSWN